MNRTFVRAVGLVAVVYVYFLIFAEFAFLEWVRPVTGDGVWLRLVMGGMAGGGVCGSLVAARTFRRGDQRPLAGWLLGAAAAALVALGAPTAGWPGLLAAALAVGFVLGGATVTLAAGLLDCVPARHLGLTVGLGTGLAYAVCNLPPVFAASPLAQTQAAIGVALLGAVLAWPRHGQTPVMLPGPVQVRGALPWVLVLLALVWMDSAAFYIIQHTEALRASMWQGGTTLLSNAGIHLGGAVLAGWWLDRRGSAAAVTGLAVLLLAGACLGGPTWLYVGGVSAYSVALVWIPARTGSPGLAAAIFAVAGWLGSALGIGMAQDLHRIPLPFVVVAVMAVAGGLFWRRQVASSPAPELGLVVLLALVSHFGSPEARAEVAAVAEAEAVIRGREVYISEGCIHCHSQYVRPGTADVVRWGPVQPLELLRAQRPPLFGNRRQGPDLLNVGNRRTSEWNRQHLLDPASISPGSRMPGYARLFQPGRTEGEDLLIYLASLGEGTLEERAAIVAGWRPESVAATDPVAAREVFGRNCASCHGAEGRGDGPLADRWRQPPPDLSTRAWRSETELARIIKFGRPGTAMAGHEALPDSTVVSLARFVLSLQNARQMR